MREAERDVYLFMKKGEQHIEEYPHMVPKLELLRFRKNLILEEMLTELGTAFIKCETSWSVENVAELTDAVIDSIYVLVGALVALGLPVEDAWREVQRANMAKFKDGLIKDEAGKVQKPEGWKPPDIWEIVNDCFANSKSRYDFERQMRS